MQNDGIEPDVAQQPAENPVPNPAVNAAPNPNPNPNAAIAALLQQNQALMMQLQQQTQLQQQQLQDLCNRRGNPFKTQAPDKFDGKPTNDVLQWLFELDQWFAMQGEQNDDNKMRYAVTLLRDDGTRWYMRLLQLDEVPVTWEAFKTVIHNRFRPTDSDQATRERLHNLRQGKMSVSEYTNHFNAQTLKLLEPLSANEELAQYKRGLNKNIRRNVEYQLPKTAEEAQEIAARFARIDLAIEAGSDVNPTNPKPQVTNESMDIDALVLNAMQRYNNNGNKFRNVNRNGTRNVNRNGNGVFNRNGNGNVSGNTQINSNVRCFECGGRGHLARDCANRKQRLSLNAIDMPADENDNDGDQGDDNDDDHINDEDGEDDGGDVINGDDNDQLFH